MNLRFSLFLCFVLLLGFGGGASAGPHKPNPALDAARIVIPEGMAGRIQGFLKRNHLRLVNLKEIGVYLVEMEEDEDASQYDQRAVARYRLYRKTIDGKSDAFRISQAVASKTADFGIVPCDLDGDGIRDYVIETHAKKRPYRIFYFRGAGGDPIECDFSQEDPMDMDSTPPDTSVWMGYTPESCNVGALGFNNGKLVSVDLNPFSEDDGLFYRTFENVRVNLESTGQLWTCLSFQDKMGVKKPLKYHIPTSIYLTMGFIAEDEAETWVRIPEPRDPGIPGDKLRKHTHVTILEHRDGYYKIENPYKDKDGHQNPDLWLRDTQVTKFPE